MESKIAIVGGVPGVGKTTVINKAIALAKQESFEITVLIFGSVMMEIAKEDYAVQHRDDMRKLDASSQIEIQRRAAKRIAERAAGKVVLVDTHYAIKTGTGSFLQGLPKWVSDELKANLLVLIETNPTEIINRRDSDRSRSRDEDSADFLFEHQLINKTIASTICQQSGALLKVIKNKQGMAKQAGRELFNSVKVL